MSIPLGAELSGSRITIGFKNDHDAKIAWERFNVGAAFSTDRKREEAPAMYAEIEAEDRCLVLIDAGLANMRDNVYQGESLLNWLENMQILIDHRQKEARAILGRIDQ